MPTILKQKTKIWSWASDGIPTPRQTGRLTFGRKLTSTSTSKSKALMQTVFCLLRSEIISRRKHQLDLKRRVFVLARAGGDLTDRLISS
jgi:hypothetical protein